MAAGESIVRWLRNDYTLSEKSAVVAWYRRHKEISMHTNDAEAKEAKKKTSH